MRPLKKPNTRKYLNLMERPSALWGRLFLKTDSTRERPSAVWARLLKTDTTIAKGLGALKTFGDSLTFGESTVKALASISEYRTTLLMYVAERNDGEACNRLLAYKAIRDTVEVRNSHGNTAVDIARYHGHVLITEALAAYYSPETMAEKTFVYKKCEGPKGPTLCPFPCPCPWREVAIFKDQ
jgi:hypothetical protein